MKKTILMSLSVLFLMAPGFANAEEKATVQEVYDMVVKGAAVVEELGEDALVEFNKPKGEFAWKDTYVFVLNCETGRIVGHPSPQGRKLTTKDITCKKTGRQIMQVGCDHWDPNGEWIEYWWTYPPTGETKRKLSFIIKVPGHPYQVGAGIYNDTTSLKELK